jgi:hypothetical protein
LFLCSNAAWTSGAPPRRNSRGNNGAILANDPLSVVVYANRRGAFPGNEKISYENAGSSRFAMASVLRYSLVDLRDNCCKLV